MLETSKRPLLDKEKRRLMSLVSSCSHDIANVIKRNSISSFIVCGVLCALTMIADKAPWMIITLVWTSLGIGIALWSIILGRHKILKRVAAYKDACAQNEADVFHIRSSEMIEFEEIEDEGACYAYQVDDNSIIFIAGQEYYSSKCFPNSDFEIVHIYDSARTLIDVRNYNYGHKLDPVRRVSSKAKEGLTIPNHLEVIVGRLADIEIILRA